MVPDVAVDVDAEAHVVTGELTLRQAMARVHPSHAAAEETAAALREAGLWVEPLWAGWTENGARASHGIWTRPPRWSRQQPQWQGALWVVAARR